MLFNYELNRRFHAVHRNGPSKLQKNGEKSTITIEYKHKKRKKPFKQEKNTILSHFCNFLKHQILSHPSIYSIYLVFNLIPIRTTFLCYRILHYLNKNERERAFAKGWQKNTLGAQKMRLKRLFSHPQNVQNKMGNEYFLLEKRQKFRNKLTNLHNIKTKRRGRV